MDAFEESLFCFPEHAIRVLEGEERAVMTENIFEEMSEKISQYNEKDKPTDPRSSTPFKQKYKEINIKKATPRHITVKSEDVIIYSNQRKKGHIVTKILRDT